MAANNTRDAMYTRLQPVHGGTYLADMLKAHWVAKLGGWPNADAELAFYKAAGATSNNIGDAANDYWNNWYV